MGFQPQEIGSPFKKGEEAACNAGIALRKGLEGRLIILK